jgi:hypothetical protein
MIEVIPFNKNIFDDFNITKYKITRYVYVNNLDLISKLLTYDLPIANKRIALRNIFDFLSYLDSKDKSIMPISSETLISFFSRDTYIKYMNILSELNVITKVPYTDGTFYTKGSLHMQYRIHNEYINNEDLAIIILEDDRSINKFSNEVNDLDIRYINTIKKLEINIPLAIEAEIQNFKDKGLPISILRKRISSIFYTKRKRFIKMGTKVNRIYHSFTNISRISRKYLNINFNSVDIVNCQPLLLVANLIKLNLPFDESYKEVCEKGLFYEDFIDINLPKEFDTPEGRKEWRNSYTKKNIYKSLFFGFDTRSKINKIFKELYPNTWESLNIINNSDISLASQLQNIESDLFNSIKPKKSNHYYTLFDAVYFDNILDRKELVLTIDRFFSMLNIKVKID